jgi:hypothetical protein
MNFNSLWEADNESNGQRISLLFMEPEGSSFLIIVTRTRHWTLARCRRFQPIFSLYFIAISLHLLIISVAVFGLKFYVYFTVPLACCMTRQSYSRWLQLIIMPFPHPPVTSCVINLNIRLIIRFCVTSEVFAAVTEEYYLIGVWRRAVYQSTRRYIREYRALFVSSVCVIPLDWAI